MELISVSVIVVDMSVLMLEECFRGKDGVFMTLSCRTLLVMSVFVARSANGYAARGSLIEWFADALRRIPGIAE